MGLKLGDLKIIFIGPSAVGKTTLKKIFFESEDPTQLLNCSLEPTYGIDITNYELKNLFNVHDLAGQQLDEWFANAFDIFYKTDLILLILDSTANWGENEQIWLKLLAVRNKQHLNTRLCIFLHKIDLLNDKSRSDLLKKCQEYNFAPKQIDYYFTSIQKTFFLDTLNAVINVLRQVLTRKKLLDFNDLHKLIFFQLALKRPYLTLDDLEKENNSNDLSWHTFLEDLKKNNFITIDQYTGQIRITVKGQSIIQSKKEKYYFKLIEHISEEKTYLNGFILADYAGRPFFHYEKEPHLFKEIFSALGDNVDIGLIAGFFLASKCFGDSIDESGFKTIEMKGKNVQFLIIMIEKIYGIFIFTNQISIGPEVIEIMKDFLTNFCNIVGKKIDYFIDSGDLSLFNDKNEETEDLIIKMIKKLKQNEVNQGKLQLQYYEKAFSNKMASLDNKANRNQIWKSFFNF